MTNIDEQVFDAIATELRDGLVHGFDQYREYLEDLQRKLDEANARIDALLDPTLDDYQTLELIVAQRALRAREKAAEG